MRTIVTKWKLREQICDITFKTILIRTTSHNIEYFIENNTLL